LVPQQRLTTILLEEHDEDLVRLGGFLKSSATARAASEESVRWRLWHRLPWLAVGLVGAMISASLLAGIESQMSANIAVAYFIPGIVYLADAVGTQTETLAVRGLSVGVGIGRVAGREAATGLLVATMVAMALPYVLHRLGYDPAFGSGPLATVVQDLLSIVIYLGAVRLIL
jgi:magnesium transporter